MSECRLEFEKRYGPAGRNPNWFAIWENAWDLSSGITSADKAVLEEMHDMIDAVDADLRIHDIDKMSPQSTLGETLLELMKAYNAATTDRGGCCARCGRYRNGP